MIGDRWHTVTSINRINAMEVDCCVLCCLNGKGVGTQGIYNAYIGSKYSMMITRNFDGAHGTVIVASLISLSR